MSNEPKVTKVPPGVSGLLLAEQAGQRTRDQQGVPKRRIPVAGKKAAVSDEERRRKNREYQKRYQERKKREGARSAPATSPAAPPPSTPELRLKRRPKSAPPAINSAHAILVRAGDADVTVQLEERAVVIRVEARDGK